MKNIIFLICIIVMLSCYNKNNDSSFIALDSPLSFQNIGIKQYIPNEVNNKKYYIVNTNIAKLYFIYQNIEYIYVASTNSNSLFLYLDTNNISFYDNTFYSFLSKKNKLSDEVLNKLNIIFNITNK